MKHTTIQLDKATVNALKKVKKYPRQTYDELLKEMVVVYGVSKNQYDDFLHKVQQEKMRELWDNKKDEEWENV